MTTPATTTRESTRESRTPPLPLLLALSALTPLAAWLLHGRRFDVHVSMGTQLEDSGLVELAMANFQKAAALRPDRIELRVGRRGRAGRIGTPDHVSSG